MKNRNTLKYNLQMFAENPPDGGEQGNNSGESANQGATQSIDYNKIQDMINKGAQQKENDILKNYFKDQGLSGDEMQQAISAFKEQKAKNTPDVNVLQTKMQALQNQAQQALVEKDATIEAIGLGLNAKQIPYILKMADFSNALDKDGKTSQEEMKKAINKVLEDFPQLKPQAEENKGFQQVGAGGSGQNNTNMDDALKAAFGLQ